MLCPHAPGELKKLLLISLGIHLAIIVLFPLIEGGSSWLGSPFTVYGARSAKPTYVLFGSTKTTASIARARKEAEKKAREKAKKLKGRKSKTPPVSLPKIKKVDTPPVEETEKSAQKLVNMKEKQQKTVSSTRKQFEKVSEQKGEKPPEEKPKSEEQKDIAKEADKTVAEAAKAPDSFQVGDQNVVNVSDKKFLFYQKHIQEEVARLWKPPLGVQEGAECVVLFVVNETGKVDSFKVESSSKILIYDLSIVRIAKEFSFDKSLWGKKFTITFRQ